MKLTGKLNVLIGTFGGIGKPECQTPAFLEVNDRNRVLTQGRFSGEETGGLDRDSLFSDLERLQCEPYISAIWLDLRGPR
jgi:hypothetical protein